MNIANIYAAPENNRMFSLKYLRDLIFFFCSNLLNSYSNLATLIYQVPQVDLQSLTKIYEFM